MYQPPRNRPPWFYQQPTSAYPGPFPKSPPQLPHEKVWRWFRRESKRAQIILACVLVLSCSLCTCVMVAAGASPTKTAIVTPTTGSQVFHATQVIAPTDTPTPKPTPTATKAPPPTPIATQAPTQPPAPTPTSPPTGVNGNPWGYDFNPGNVIYNPPSAFCSYFTCIASFWNGKGYVVACSDGMYSKSGGRGGSCSRHGGDAQVVYSH